MLAKRANLIPDFHSGSGYYFGMCISPITRGDRSSTSSGASNNDYEVWRTWEDCLWFQDVLELEYKRKARQKRQRLLAGKGVKKDGFYKQDLASSFESLPPGPDPNSVAQDVHAYVPKLTKKGTLFRASQATIDQRKNELSAFVEGLFKDTAPALLKEIRSDRIVTDFFGYWRRDRDLAQKQAKPRAGKERERGSVTSSIFSSYFSGSVASAEEPTTSPSVSTHSSPSKSSTHSDYPIPGRRRAQSAASSDSSSGPSSRSSIGSITSAPGIAGDGPLVFDHNPLADRSLPLEDLPEDREYNASATDRGRKASATDIIDRRTRVRESWQTTASATTYLEGLNMTLPSAPDLSQNARSRMSVSSVATFMTDASADAIIPRSFIAEVSTAKVKRSLSAGSRYRRSVSGMSIPETATGSDSDDDVVDTYFYGISSDSATLFMYSCALLRFLPCTRFPPPFEPCTSTSYGKST